MKKLFGISLIFILSVLIITFWGIRCGFGLQQIVTGVVAGNSEEVGAGFGKSKICHRFIPGLENLPVLLGNNNYLILLQNNWEIRPSGGFMGSYAIADFEDSALKDLKAGDIYDPDGQLPGHVEPPKPILQAFPHGFWKLRDANWELDFQDSARQTVWFFEKGGVENIDAVIALNFSTIKKVLKITGPIKVLDYSEELTADNFYEKAQAEAQVNFFPGSRAKSSFLSAALKSLQYKLKDLSLIQKLELARLAKSELDNGETMLWSPNPQLNNIFLGNDWGGQIKFEQQDFLYLASSNLSSNKANCCVLQNVQLNIDSQTGEHTLKIIQENRSSSSQSNPPQNWGGDYKNFQRVVIPLGAEVENVQVDNINLDKLNYEDDRPQILGDDRYFVISERKKYEIISFWFITDAQNKSSATVNYKYKIDKYLPFGFIQQPGIEDSVLRKVTLDGR